MFLSSCARGSQWAHSNSLAHACHWQATEDNKWALRVGAAAADDDDDDIICVYSLAARQTMGRLIAHIQSRFGTTREKSDLLLALQIGSIIF